MVIEKVPLIADRREWLRVLLVWILLLVLHLGWIFHEYRDFIDRPFYYTHATVLQSYPHDAYRILKIRTDAGKTFYTKTYRKEPLLGRRIRLELFPERLGFLDYLRGGYLPSRIKSIQTPPPKLRELLIRRVGAQHEDPEISRFYQAIFFAAPLDRALRQKIAALGISHLVALSGFHLGILWGMLFLLLAPLYRLLQDRYFPWRHERLDLGSITLAMLAGYLLLTGSPPSLLRSYAMLAVGWAALLLGIELRSFTFLLVVTGLLILLFPPLALSMGFWLSVLGVFYIYLLLHYWGERSMRLFASVILPVGLMLLMLPVTHALFPSLSGWQWLSPILSLLFIPFYPLAIALHLIGHGDLFDPLLLRLWDLPSAPASELLPLWVLGIYLPLSIAAVRFRRAFLLLWVFVGACAVFLYL